VIADHNDIYVVLQSTSVYLIRKICSYWSQDESQAYGLIYTVNRIRVLLTICMDQWQ